MERNWRQGRATVVLDSASHQGVAQLILKSEKTVRMTICTNQEQPVCWRCSADPPCLLLKIQCWIVWLCRKKIAICKITK